MSNEKAITKELRLERVYPDSLQTHYVSNILVQHQPDMFVISFFEVWPPAILSENKEDLNRQLATVDHVDAKCVSRIVVSPSRMKEFLDAMSENFNNYEALMLSKTE
jgi:hypothetical protein